MRRFNLILLALLLVIGIPFYWLLLDNRPGDAQPKPIALTDLRALAESIPGAKPARLEGEVAAYRSVPRDLFAAGAGLKRTNITVLAWRLSAADGKSIVIDSGITAKDANTMKMDRIDSLAQRRIERGLREASLVLFTHEHLDHMAAALQLAGGLPSGVRLSPGQIPSAKLAAKLPWPAGSVPAALLSSDRPQAVAPGVVVIPAPGSHTPGSQLIYVRMADQRELLFTGDIATLSFSWKELRARSNLITTFLAPENRSEVYAWLKTIRLWKDQAPALEVIPGHEMETLYPQEGNPPVANLHFGFELQH